MNSPVIIEVLPIISGKAADGPSYSVTRLCEILIKLNLNITMINCDCTKISTPPTYIKRFSLGYGPKRLCRSPAMYRWLEQLAINNEINLLHSHGLWTMSSIYPGLIGHKYDIPLVISPRGSLADWAFNSGSFVKKIFWPLYQRPALNKAACLHATSEAEYLDIRRYGFKQPVAVIPNGIDIPPLLTSKPIDGKRTLLFLGRINPIKGLDLLLPAWAAIQHKFPDWQLHIAGPDSRGYLKVVKKMAENLKLERIEFLGLLSGDDKWRAYQTAEIYILPSYTENFGVTIAEALASGVPAIVTRGTPWAELGIRNAGWWIGISIDALEGCLHGALNKSPQELSMMGQNGKSWMIQDFSWDIVGQKMKATYSWLINGGAIPDCVRIK